MICTSKTFIIILRISIIIYLYPLTMTAMYPTSNVHKDLDICNHWNGRRHFLELGERGDLHARNVTISAFRSTLLSPTSVWGTLSSSNITFKSDSSADIWYQCNLELVTCAECIIRITFTHANFSKSCERIINPSVGKSTMCPCEHIQFSEPPYDAIISGQEFCGDGNVFRSKTRTLLLKFFYRATNSHVFSLQYFSERNVKMISGSPRQTLMSLYKNQINMKFQVISTPYFPMNYPRDYGIEHILTCEAENCHVRLDFTDFQLGLTSTLEVYDSNGQMLDSYTGEHFRPPIIISSGKSLLLQFHGNGNCGSGFRAEVTFISDKQLNGGHLMPYTDCGGMVSGPGGAITMMNMIENATDVRYFDCIWIIKPDNNYMMLKTHISLRVEEFHGMASRSDLTIREGLISDSLEIEKVVWPNNGMAKENHVVPILTGYYIRLRGVFGVSSKLAIVYSVFNYLNCYIGSEFLCSNNHCISIRLHCDGFDHCGDGSDEPDTCEEDWAHLQNDRRWYSHKPNYYFPKMEHYPDLKTATGIFIISTLGIFAVLSGWMIVLYRMSVRARHQRELQNHLQTISELLDSQEEVVHDEPPVYEAPPDYEEIIKVGMVEEMRSRHTTDRERNRHRGREECSTSTRTLTPSRLDTPTISTAATTAEATSIVEAHSIVQFKKCENESQKNIPQHLATIAHNRETSSTNQTSEMSKTTIKTTSTLNNCTCKYIENGDSEFPSKNAILTLTKDTLKNNNTNPNISCSTSTQLEEECTNNYCNDSLKISLSMAIPPNTNNTSENPESILTHQNLIPYATEQTHLKRSWMLITDRTQSYKFQRLRHTRSLPDRIQMHHRKESKEYNEPYNYGTISSQDHNFISKTNNNSSNLISELSRDTTILSITMQHKSSLEQLYESLIGNGQIIIKKNSLIINNNNSAIISSPFIATTTITTNNNNNNNNDFVNNDANKWKHADKLEHSICSKSFTNAEINNSLRNSNTTQLLKRSFSLADLFNNKHDAIKNIARCDSETKIYMI